MPLPFLVHMSAGALAIVIGFAVLFSPKGGSLHRRGGLAFVASMLVLALSGAAIAAWLGDVGTVVGGLLASYLTVTALVTVKPVSAGWRRALVGATCVGVLVASVSATRAVMSIGRTSAVVGYLVFGTVAALAVRGDLAILRGAVLRGAPRLRRHVWRACIALWFATASFFLGPRRRVEKVLPDALISSTTVIIPVALVIIVMLYWLWRLRSRTALRGMVLGGKTTP
ncbi:MAG: hypothetical protein H0W15_00525 [Gemmatimonadales bacterium]|nr:hypothetical protein [Gemmatimonadales bacterium]